MGSPNPKSTPSPRLPAPTGGLNVRVHPFDIAPNEVANCYNVDFQYGGIRVRKGQSSAIDNAHKNVVAGIRGMHRYRTSAGVKKIIMNSGGTIEAANDATLHQFHLGAPAVMTPDQDGFVCFEQYKDSLLLTTDNDNAKWYNTAGAPTNTITPHFLAFPVSTGNSDGGVANDGFSVTKAATGGFLLKKWYLYRMTWDVTHGGDFLGETGATAAFSMYQRHAVDFTGSATDTSMLTIKKTDALLGLIPDWCTTLNIYRSGPYDALPTNYIINDYEDPNLYQIGSVTKAAILAAPSNGAIFIDLGDRQPQDAIPTGAFGYQPRARYARMHGGYMCLGNVYEPNESPIQLDTTPSFTKRYPDRVYFSRFLANAEEPLAFPVFNWIEVDHYDGEGITGIHSYDDELLVWKPNSMHGVRIAGAQFGEVPVVSKRPISGDVGCIAPHSIVAAKGTVAWLSNTGFHYYDGTVPQPLPNTEKIQPILDAIPAARRRLVSGLYKSKTDELVWFFSKSDYEDGNLWALIYSFVTHGWRQEKYPRGVGTAMEVKDSDGTVRVLYGLDDNSSLFLAGDPILIEADNGNTDALETPVGIQYLVEGPFLSYGTDMLDKRVDAAYLEGAWTDVLTFIGFRVDGRVDTTINLPLANKLIAAPTGGKGMKKSNWSEGAIWGKRIQHILTGTSFNGGADFTAIYVEMAPQGYRDT